MPEGDTVWRSARQLHEALGGQVLTSCDIRVPAHATVDLSGHRVDEVVSRGKHLLTRFADTTIHTHPKMEGSWHIYRPGSKWRRPAHQARIVLGVPRWQAVGFSLGAVDVLARTDEASVVGHLGPDLLGPDWDAGTAVANLLREPDRPVGDALLDQQNLAGIGNLYRAELCFLAGVHPATPVAKVSDLRRLVERAQLVLDANKSRAAQTTTGDTHHGRRTWVYLRQGQPCRRCGTPIRHESLGDEGRERGAFWCPACQPPG